MRSNLLIQQTSEIFAHLFKFPKISEKGIDYNVILYTGVFFHPMLILSLHTFILLCPVLNSPDPGFVSFKKTLNLALFKMYPLTMKVMRETKTQTWSKHAQYMSVTFLFTLFHRYYEDSWLVCTSCVVLYNIASPWAHLGYEALWDISACYI